MSRLRRCNAATEKAKQIRAATAHSTPDGNFFWQMLYAALAHTLANSEEIDQALRQEEATAERLSREPNPV